MTGHRAAADRALDVPRHAEHWRQTAASARKTTRPAGEDWGRLPPWWVALSALARQQGADGPADSYRQSLLDGQRMRGRIAVALRGAEVTQLECVHPGLPARDDWTLSDVERMAAVPHTPIEWYDCPDSIRLAACAGHPEAPQCDETAGRPRWAARAARIHGTDLVLDGRELSAEWVADPQTAADQLTTCSTTWSVGRGAETGALMSSPMGCKSPLCPVCAHYKAAAKQEKQAPIFESLAAQGCQLVHVTLTQPQDVTLRHDRPVLLSERERTHLGDVQGQTPAELGAWGAPVAGETLAESVQRLRDAFDRLRDSRAHREWWRTHVAGYSYGVEWTGRATDGRLRWHAHLHVLLILRPRVMLQTTTSSSYSKMTRKVRHTVTVTGGQWWRSMLQRWRRCTQVTGDAWMGIGGAGRRVLVVDYGANPTAQCARVVGVESVADELREVLKYPFKPASLTDAQIIEVLTSGKGCRWHQVGGCIHGASNVCRAAKDMAALPADAPDGLAVACLIRWITYPEEPPAPKEPFPATARGRLRERQYLERVRRYRVACRLRDQDLDLAVMVARALLHRRETGDDADPWVSLYRPKGVSQRRAVESDPLALATTIDPARGSAMEPYGGDAELAPLSTRYLEACEIAGVESVPVYCMTPAGPRLWRRLTPSDALAELAAAVPAWLLTTPETRARARQEFDRT